MVGISVVVPVFDEEGSLSELHRRLTGVLDHMQRPYEIIFVDDGSSDRSLQMLKVIHDRDPRTKVLSFRRRYGKSAALAVGFDEAEGDIIVTIDADLQDDPGEIPRLIEHLESGYDLVSGWKRQRRDPISKTIPSKIFNRVTAWVTGLSLHDMNCGLKAYRREVTDQIKLYGQLHRFLPVFAHKEGFRVGEVPVTHHPRKFGKTKYGLSRFLHGFLDLLTVVLVTGYTTSPLHFFGTIGVVFTLIGLVINCIITGIWLKHGNIQGRHPLLTLGVLLMILGFTLISTGLLGELITRMGHADRSQYGLKLKLPSRQEAKDSRDAETS
jgi:glycosyltransferase involved in cell wall biosynthesis